MNKKNKKFLSRSLEILFYLIGVIPVISCLVVVYWFYHRTDRNESFAEHPKFTYAIYISAFITLMGVLSIGIKSALFFIPWDWGGYNEDGDWESTRESIALMLAFFSTGFIVQLFSDHDKMKKEIDYLEEKVKNLSRMGRD